MTTTYQEFLNVDDLNQRFSTKEIASLAAAGKSTLIALADANSIMSAYLAPVYALPIAPIPEFLKAVGADIARYRLYSDSPSEAITDRYKDALAMLEKVRDRRLVLDINAADTTKTGTPEKTVFSSKAGQVVFSERVVSDGSLF